MAVVSVSMPDALADQLDEFVDGQGYAGRSEAIREGVRGLLSEFDDVDLSDRPLMCVATAVFEYGSPRVERRVSDLRHDHLDLVADNAHSHIGDGYCVELFVVQGRLETISAFVGETRSIAGIHSVEYVLMPIDGIESLVAAE